MAYTKISRDTKAYHLGRNTYMDTKPYNCPYREGSKRVEWFTGYWDAKILDKHGFDWRQDEINLNDSHSLMA